MSSYLYYKEDKTKIPDEIYDYICKVLYDHFDAFESQHKHLVKRDDFKAGTGFFLTYPQMVIAGAKSWYDDKQFILEM